MIVELDRVQQLRLTSQVRQVAKVRKVRLEGPVHQVPLDSEVTVDAMVSQVEMVCLAPQGLTASLVPLDCLAHLEELERQACLVYQGPRAGLVTRAEMEDEAHRDGLVRKVNQEVLASLVRMV